jgi:hypothetical protein
MLFSVLLHNVIHWRNAMSTKLLAIAAAAGLLFGSCVSGFAQNSTPERTPGDKMQDKGSVKGSPGRSGDAPGQPMKEKGSVKGTTGASGYAPGRDTTGAGVRGGADIDAGPKSDKK